MITIAVGPRTWSLNQELTHVDELRGLVRPVPVQPRPGEPGALGSTLVVVLGQGGAVTALVLVLVAWLRRHVGSVSGETDQAG